MDKTYSVKDDVTAGNTSYIVTIEGGTDVHQLEVLLQLVIEAFATL